MGTYNRDFTVCQCNFSTINKVGTRGNSKYRLIVSEGIIRCTDPSKQTALVHIHCEQYSSHVWSRNIHL